MKYISHRGNLNGRIPQYENKPEYIESAIKKGFDVEVDLRFINGKFYLGHDLPENEINLKWLNKNSKNLWVHCKDLDTLYFLTNKNSKLNYFWHQNDFYTLTSKNYIWTFPEKPITSKSVIVLHDLDLNGLLKAKKENCFGVCSDYIEKLKNIE
jgi:hypothetical protein